MLFVRSSTMPTAMNQVTSVARKATPAPPATGRRYDSSDFTMLAVIAESTRMHSSPSRNTRTPISKICAREPDPGARGFGLPAAVTPCQINAPITRNAPEIKRMGRSRLLVRDVWRLVSKYIAIQEIVHIRLIRSQFVSVRFVGGGSLNFPTMVHPLLA